MSIVYNHAGIIIINSDCSDVISQIKTGDNKIAQLFPQQMSLVTDPPYGIKADKAQANRANKQQGKAVAPSRDYGEVTNWDANPVESQLLNAWISRCNKAIIWGANYFKLEPATCWLVWDKQTGNNGYADAELAWSNLGGAVRMFRHQWMGMLQAKSDDSDARVHPTQKPVALMRWCLSKLPKDVTVVDPFMGSGTTLVAAKSLGMKCIGIEAEQRYCRIAATRLSQEVLPL